MIKFFIGLALKFLSSRGYKVLTVEEHDDLLYTKGIAESTKKFLGEFDSLMFVLSFTRQASNQPKENEASIKLKELMDKSFLDLEFECLNFDSSLAPSQLKLGRQKGYALSKNLKECIDCTLAFNHQKVKELKRLNNDLKLTAGRLKKHKDDLQKRLERLDPKSSPVRRKRRKDKPIVASEE